MRIGIDIDDTTMITVKSMLKYADIYDVEVLGKSGTNGNMGLIQNRYYLKALYGWNQEEKMDFFNKYYKNVLEECEFMPGAVDIIKKLKNEGNEIYFITARLIGIQNCDTETITKKSLQVIPYDKLILHTPDKLKASKENNIDVFIEDSYDTCKELTENGIKSYLMTSKMNENIETGEIERVHNWTEVYEKLKDFSKISNK